MPLSSAQTSPTGTTLRGAGDGRLDAVLRGVTTGRAELRRVLRKVLSSLRGVISAGGNFVLDNASSGVMPQLDWWGGADP